MNRTVSSTMAICISFIAGLLVCMGAYWFVQAYLFPPASLEVLGVLQLQTQPSSPSATGNPPNGYFVESTATDRFYLEGDLVKPYVGSLVLIKGTISTVCGADAYPCYPKLLAKSVTQVSESG